MTLEIKVVSAFLTRDTQSFSNMDPYCQLSLGTENQRTKTKEEAGSRPVFNETFTFKTLENKLRVVIKDEDPLISDMIGDASIDVSKFRANPVQQQETIPLVYDGKPAGRVVLRFRSLANGNNQWNQNPNANTTGPFSAPFANVAAQFGNQYAQGGNQGVNPGQGGTNPTMPNPFGNVPNNWG